MKQVVIEIPDDKEVQWVNNVLTLVDKKPKVEIKTYDDLITNEVKLSGYVINSFCNIQKITYKASKNVMDTATSEKVAKSMLAMAQISQLIPYYGGKITDEEWKNDYNKYTIARFGNEIQCWTSDNSYRFLAFHTLEQRDEFLKNNERLVKDYLMLD